MVIAGLTTYVVTVEVISYFILDMFGYAWHHTRENKHFRRAYLQHAEEYYTAGGAHPVGYPIGIQAA